MDTFLFFRFSNNPPLRDLKSWIFFSYFWFGATIAILRDITEGGIDISLACMPIRIFGSDFLESCLKIPLVQIGSIPESARSVQVQEKVAH